MRFSVFVPPRAETEAVPALYFLAGLTCTEETFQIKAGAQRVAADLGLLLISPDTSPRGAGIAGEDDDWDFGTGAGFYVDATAEPWSRHYRMYSYVTRELYDLVSREFPVRPGRQGIFGHSMGGHGALVCALRESERFRSVSAFAPISAPSDCPWGQKALGRYLGPDRAAWAQYDASRLLQHRRFPETILVDQGTKDPYLESQLFPQRLTEAARANGQPLTLRLQPGFDHGYYFISTFIEDHLNHHHAILARP